MNPTVVIKVNGEEATSAKAGDTVTVEIEYANYHNISSYSVTTGGGTGVTVTNNGTVANGSNNVNTYPFTMPEDNVTFAYEIRYNDNEPEIW